MDSQSRNPLSLKNTGRFDCIHRAGIPANPDLRGDRQTIRRRDHGASHVRKKRAILEKSGSPISGNNLIHRASKIQINKIRRNPIDHRFDRFRKTIWIGTEKLDPERAFIGLEFQVATRALIPMQDTLGRNKLRRQDISPQILAQTSEDGIRHTGHRS
jgi:hypothetical protein